MTILKEQGFTKGATDKLARQTFSGMAHFAGTGPHGKICKQCKLWDYDPIKSPDETKARCKKYKALTNKVGNMVPRDAQACKHFENR